MKACEQCGKNYNPLRVSSKYCSDECRVKAHRQAKKLKRIELDKDKASDMVWLLKSKIEALLEDVKLGQDMVRSAKDEESRRVWQNMLIRYEHTYNELKALWDCLGLEFQVKCANCGQKRLDLPIAGDKCSFCHQKTWLVYQKLVKA